MPNNHKSIKLNCSFHKLTVDKEGEGKLYFKIPSSDINKAAGVSVFLKEKHLIVDITLAPGQNGDNE